MKTIVRLIVHPTGVRPAVRRDGVVIFREECPTRQTSAMRKFIPSMSKGRLGGCARLPSLSTFITGQERSVRDDSEKKDYLDQ